MNFIMALLASMASVVALPVTKRFDIKSEISVNGKLISAPKIMAIPDKTANASSTNKDGSQAVSLELVASDMGNGHGEDGILMDFTVSYMNEKKKISVSKAQVISRSGETSEVFLGENGTDKIKIKVVAKRIK